MHEKLVWQEYTYQPNDYPYQGFRYHCPGLKTPHTVVYNGYNPTAWLPASGVTRKPKSFLTVCAGLHMRFTQKLKGIDLILEAARQLPDAVFTIVGAPEGYRFPDQPENLTLLPLMPLADLRAVYSAHFFYLQLSLSEGFPNALSESMLCGCVPIVSHVAGMPDIVGDSGYVLPKKDPTLLAQLLKKAIADAKAIDGLKCRERIATHFPAIKREQALLQLLHTLRK
ncbi:glycosyltransferase family 4 protein [Rufibacter roseus]|uniref:glycosyltransferase family 4 protein n=1 Tax=Rufibacter roseus TaxID=1567108 RepID=UPI0036732413